MRLQWEAFQSWIKREDRASSEKKDEVSNLELVNSVLEQYRQASSLERRQEAFLVLCNVTKDTRTLMSSFKQAASSRLFQFWDNYISMVLLLLKFIRAEREGN